MKQDENAVLAMMGCSATVVGLVLLDVVLAVYRGWVVAILWGWFAEPLGAPALSTASAAGCVLIVAAVASGRTRWKDHDVDVAATLLQAFIGPLAVLLTGRVLLAVL